MFCDKHESTELMRRAGQAEELGGVTWEVTFLYCPYCKKDKGKIFTRDGEVTVVRL